MGRQINFFMVGEDEKEFVAAIYKSGDSIIDRFGNTLTQDEVIRETWGRVFINFPQSRIIKYTDSKYFDNQISDVIEFKRSKVKDNRVEAGRLYIDLIDYDENGNKIRREKWLEDKYNSYKKWIVKHCKISEDKMFYIGKYTYKLNKENKYKMVDHLNVNKPELEVAIDFE